mgnify:CR=1
MNSFCSNCGTPISGNFCVNCGKQVSTQQINVEENIKTQPPQTTGLSIASLIMSFIFPPAGLIMGIVARKEIINSQNEKSGEGLAWAAIIISTIAIVFWVVIIFSILYLSGPSIF